MVSEMVFSVFCRKAIFLNRYPTAIPVNINPIIENIYYAIMRLKLIKSSKFQAARRGDTS